MQMYKEISACRVSGKKDLLTVLNLGYQSLTGVFPKSADEHVTVGPLELVWSPDSGLLQLKHSYEPSEMYGDNYGYRSEKRRVGKECVSTGSSRWSTYHKKTKQLT